MHLSQLDNKTDNKNPPLSWFPQDNNNKQWREYGKGKTARWLTTTLKKRLTTILQPTIKILNKCSYVSEDTKYISSLLRFDTTVELEKGFFTKVT